jgi:hypothetical protein
MYLSEGGGEGRIQPPVWLLRGGCVGIFTNLKTRWLVARHLAEDGSGMTDDRPAKSLRALLASVEAAALDKHEREREKKKKRERDKHERDKHEREKEKDRVETHDKEPPRT